MHVLGNRSFLVRVASAPATLLMASRTARLFSCTASASHCFLSLSPARHSLNGRRSALLTRLDVPDQVIHDANRAGETFLTTQAYQLCHVLIGPWRCI